MKVYLGIGTKPPIELDTKSPASRVLVASAGDLVKARIVLDGDESALTESDDVSFILQTGMDPDVRVEAQLECGKSEGRFLCRQKRDGKWHEDDKYRLFQGNLGATCLYVMNRYDSDMPPWRLAVVEVFNGSKGKLYDGMVGEILRLGLPHYVIADFKWQMYRNKFSLRWSDGYTSYDDETVMLRLLSSLIRRELLPNVREIARALQLRFIAQKRMVSLERVSRMNKSVRRNIARLMRYRSIETIDDLDSGKIMASVRMASADIPAHTVIRTFLEHFVLRRLDIIEESFLSRLTLSGKEMEGMKTGSRQKSRLNKWAEAKAVADSVRRKIALVRELRSRIKTIVRLPFLAVSNPALTVFDVDSKEFSATIHYRRIYHAMREYSRTCFWWASDTSDGCWRIPQIELSDQGETRLQKKYSSVYENWCYARMLAAMTNLGFIREESVHEAGEGTICIFKKNGVTVKVIHGIVALPKEDCEFYLTDQGRFLLTPDFAIVISAQGVNNACWIVADAKSDDCLRSHMVEARNKYASKILRYGKQPMASVLFRSGDSNKESPLAGIEFPPPPVVEWAETNEHNLEEAKNDHSCDDYRWRPGYGVVPGSKTAPTFHGHVRANIISVGKTDRIFEEFMDGIIQTALRRIGVISV